MKIYPIKTYGSEILRKKAREIEQITPEIHEIADRMIYTMKHKNGIGLAAPQVGLGIRLIIVTFGLENDEAEPRAMVNPEIVWHGEDTDVMEEGCLSIPDTHGDVRRWTKIRVKSMNLDGEQHEESLEGITARIAQHEIDHLDGVLFIDRMPAFRREIVKRKLRKMLKKENLKA